VIHEEGIHEGEMRLLDEVGLTVGHHRDYTEADTLELG
jgi:hypothetical protein